MHIREMDISDYPQLVELFRKTPGVALREADTRQATAKYLDRNPGLSFVSEIQNQIIGCVMCGHDGRRGYLQHLVVAPNTRKQGLGENLFQKCILALADIGIDKTHIFVFKDNSLANTFWASKGWSMRDDINQYSYTHSGNENA